MLTNHFNIEERKKFMILENEICGIHGKHPKITFPNDGVEIQTCCAKFENDVLSKINVIRQKIIEARP